MRLKPPAFAAHIQDMRCRIGAFFLALSVVTAQNFPANEARWRQEALRLLDNAPAVKTVDPEITEYLAVLGARLAGPSTMIRFIAYDSSAGLDLPWLGSGGRVIEAKPLPGGILLVPLSLFEASADESELAAAISRGIAHIWSRDFLRINSARVLVRPIPPADPRLREESLGKCAWCFPRAFEIEADRSALSILAAANFNPYALLRNAANPRTSFDTSVARGERIQEELSHLPQRTYGPDDSAVFQSLKAQIRERAVL